MIELNFWGRPKDVMLRVSLWKFLGGFKMFLQNGKNMQ